jgi:hypothetical protein
MHELRIINSGKRPPCYLVANYLWGAGCDIDSDGNSATREDEAWTELTLILRADPSQRIDIDPIGSRPLVLKVVASNEALAASAATMIVEFGGGHIESLPNSLNPDGYAAG